MNYAIFGLLYLRSIERLPIDVAQCVLKVMHHNKGIWNGICSDMFIETTFMRYDHGKQGMIGITSKPDTMKVWALILHLWKKLQADIAEMCHADVSQLKPHRKEEVKRRIAAEAGLGRSCHRA